LSAAPGGTAPGQRSPGRGHEQREAASEKRVDDPLGSPVDFNIDFRDADRYNGGSFERE